MKSPKFSGSIGSQIIIAQEQYRHQRRLDEIYNKKSPLSSMTINQQYLVMSSNRNSFKMSKKSFNEEMNHHLTIKHLIQRLNSPKSFNQRVKDSNDFIAYPALFFRNTDEECKKKKTIKQKKRNKIAQNQSNLDKNSKKMPMKNVLNNESASKSQNSNKKQKSKAKQMYDSQSANSQLPHNGLTIEKVAKELPHLEHFEQQNIEEFADHLTRIIFKYNLNTMQDIQFLFQCVQQYLPSHYPEHFVNAIEDMFKQIVNSLNIQE